MREYEFIHRRSIRINFLHNTSVYIHLEPTWSAKSPVNIYLEFFSALIFCEPTRNIVLLSSASITSANLNRLFLDSLASLRNGYAIAHISAPNAMHFANSIPLRRPPEATTGIFTAFLTSMRLAAVGIPQSQNNSPKCILSSSFTVSARNFSTPAQLVPPEPATLIAEIPAISKLTATSLDI